MEYYARRDWGAALDVVLPRRKRADYEKGQKLQKDQQHQIRSGWGGEASSAAAEVGPEAAVGEAAPAAAAGTVEPIGADVTASGAYEDAGPDLVAVAGEEADEGRGTKRKAEVDLTPTD